MSDKTERTKEGIIKPGGLLNAAQDWARQGYGWTSIDYQLAAEAGFLAGAKWMEEYRQSSPVESKWVSVKERPNTNCYVAVRTKNHSTEIMSYHAHPEEGREFYKWMFGRWVKQTHLVELWMFLFVHPPKPIPELPIEEPKEK